MPTQDEIITAQRDLRPITVQEMIDLAPRLFCASPKFLVAERHSLPLALKP